MAQATLSVFNDFDPGFEERYELWYQSDHFPDRASVPGFRHGRRYRKLRGSGREYFTFHEVDTLGVLTAEPYLVRLREPTPETVQLMSHFRRVIRTASTVEVDRGGGIGGMVGVLILARPRAEALAAWRAAATALFDRWLTTPGLTRARLWCSDDSSTNVDNPESRLRPEASQGAGSIVMVEGTLEARILAALKDIGAAPPFRDANPPADPPIYTLLFASLPGGTL